MIRRKTFNWEMILLALIFFAGTLLRFDRLESNPPALNWDEISHGYNAYSVLLTGHDEWGVSWPTIFLGFGDYKLPVYIYLTSLAVKLFGLTAFSVRFISAAAGSLAILGIYWFTRELFAKTWLKLGKQKFSLGLLSALAIAFMPWHFFLSRPALEANLSLSLIIFGFAALWTRSRPWLTFVGLTLLALSLHTYNSARVFVPLMLVVWFALSWRQWKINWGLIGGLIVLSLSFGLVWAQVRTGTGLARYQKLAILSETAVFDIGQKRLESTLPQPLPKLVHNRPVYFATQFGSNYAQYFSPSFIYQNQGAQYQFAIPGVNLLGIPILLLALLGVAYCVKNWRSTNAALVLSWLLLAPVPAALTADPPQALRPLYLIAAFSLLAALGAKVILSSMAAKPRWQYWAAIALAVTVLFAFGRYWNNYWSLYQTEYASSWQDGNRQLWQYILEEEKNYDQVIVTKRLGEPHIFLGFYAQVPPQNFWPGESTIRYQQSDWYWTDRVGKYYFVNDWDLTAQTVGEAVLESGGSVSFRNALVVASPGNLPQELTKIKQIRNINDELVFEIGKQP
jgi:4-amino-4-deoxy-L-arabinose transferase-like glycosyltransferase